MNTELAATKPDLATATNPMELWPTCSAKLGLAEIRNLPERLDETMMANLQEVMRFPIPEHEPCPKDFLDRALTGMLANLPRQGKDTASGELMMETYRRKLQKHPKGAIAYLWSESIERLEWFPVIAVCNQFIAEWTAQTQGLKHAKDAAKSRYLREKDLRFRDAMDDLRHRSVDQAKIDAMPQEWKDHAVAQGYLWHLTDGSYLACPSTIGMTEEERAAHRARVDKLREDGLL